MKLSSSIATVLLLLLTSCNQSRLKTPEISFEQKIVRFGKLKYNKNLFFDIKYLNTGNAKLIIKKIYPTCDCSQIIKFDREISPGSSGKAIMKIALVNNNIGFISKKIVFETNTSKSLNIIRIEGTIIN